MTVVAIISVVSAISYVNMLNGIRRTRVSTAAIELTSVFQEGRQRAALKGRDVLLVVVQATGTSGSNAGSCAEVVTDARCARWWLLEDAPAVAFDLPSFDPASPTSQGDVLAASGVLAKAVRFGVDSAFTSIAPPAPFATLPNPASTYAGIVKGCSFCSTAGMDPARGFVRFTPEGEVRFGTTPASTTGGVLFVTSGLAGESRGFGITVPSGITTSRFWTQR